MATRAYWKLRLFVKWLSGVLHLNGIVGMVEYCDACGIRQPLVWYAKDADWLEITGEVGGIYCPKCFSELAHKKGIALFWRPEIEYRFKKAVANGG